MKKKNNLQMQQREILCLTLNVESNQSFFRRACDGINAIHHCLKPPVFRLTIPNTIDPLNNLLAILLACCTDTCVVITPLCGLCAWSQLAINIICSVVSLLFGSLVREVNILKGFVREFCFCFVCINFRRRLFAKKILGINFARINFC